MNTSIMRCKNVSSTAPMTGRISPWAIPFFLPCCSALQDKVFQCVHDGSQGAGRAPYMGLQAQTAEKFADRPDSHTSFEAEHQQRGHDQADQPGAACCRFPQRRLRVAVSTANCLKMAMHAAFGKPGVIRQAPDALFAVITNRIEDDNALGPQSHRVGPRSEGWLKSWKKSALQSTRSTTGCPGLSGCPQPPRSIAWAHRPETMARIPGMGEARDFVPMPVAQATTT